MAQKCILANEKTLAKKDKAQLFQVILSLIRERLSKGFARIDCVAHLFIGAMIQQENMYGAYAGNGLNSSSQIGSHEISEVGRAPVGWQFKSNSHVTIVYLHAINKAQLHQR